MNNNEYFHRVQNFRQFSNLFSQIWLKKRHTSLFSGICREIRTKFHQKFARKNAKFDAENEKNRKFSILREKMLTIFGWNFEIEERCKRVHCVDLGESFPTSIYLQKSASIQPRTSPSKFGGKYSILFTGVLRNSSTGRSRRTIHSIPRTWQAVGFRRIVLRARSLSLSSWGKFCSSPGQVHSVILGMSPRSRMTLITDACHAGPVPDTTIHEIPYPLASQKEGR